MILPAGSWQGGTWRGIATDDGWKLAVSESGPRLLSDLDSDPLELVNLAGRPEVCEVECELQERIYAWRLQTETVQ